jgi:hypothetical protein
MGGMMDYYPYDFWFYPRKYLMILEIQAALWTGVEIDRDISESLIEIMHRLLHSPFVAPLPSDEG